MKHSKILLFVLILSFQGYSQNFKPHIGLNDRLMNSFFLCDRSVSESIEAWYGQHDSAAYNVQYDIMIKCSEKADLLALNKVLAGKMKCSKAESILFANGLTCQVDQDEKDDERIQNCRSSIIKICDEFLIEKGISSKKKKDLNIHF